MSQLPTTHNVYLESADFHILVIEFPEDDINDKLALLATEKGTTHQPFYEDFVIGTCMSNAVDFFSHIREQGLFVEFADIRREILSLVYKHNPGFLPANIVANQNNVLKTKGSVVQEETSRPLVDNDLWDREPPLPPSNLVLEELTMQETEPQRVVRAGIFGFLIALLIGF